MMTRLCPADRLSDASCRLDVVVLDENAVEEPEAVVCAASGPHRVLLEKAQSRRGLPGVGDPHRQVSHPVCVGPGERRDARESLQYVERRPLAGKKAAGV